MHNPYWGKGLSKDSLTIRVGVCTVGAVASSVVRYHWLAHNAGPRLLNPQEIVNRACFEIDFIKGLLEEK
jgi:hypothetical protein